MARLIDARQVFLTGLLMAAMMIPVKTASNGQMKRNQRSQGARPRAGPPIITAPSLDESPYGSTQISIPNT